MSDLESDLVERKESATDRKKIRRNVCAFANDLPGSGRPGVVLVGVRDDGSCASLPIDDALLTRLANIHGDGDIWPRSWPIWGSRNALASACCLPDKP